MNLLRIQSRPIRIVLRWQLLATVVASLLSGWIAGVHGAVSAALGGAICIGAGLVFALVASKSSTRSAGEALIWALRAEGIRLVLMVVLLWLVLAIYPDVVVAGLIGSFIVSVLIFAMAAFVREA
jgi:ATP synthase protein I